MKRKKMLKKDIVLSLILIKDTKNDNDRYNHDYFKPCKSEYIIKHTIYKCPFCLEYYPKKFRED